MSGKTLGVKAGGRFILTKSSNLTEWITIYPGPFKMGSDQGFHPEDGEGPAREVYLDSFEIAATAVSIAEFRVFVNETSYVTLAERKGSSHVFHQQLKEPSQHPVANPEMPWWRRVDGASWRHPFGSVRTVDPSLPAVHLSWQDCFAYCLWAGCRLPTEAEWEKAVRAGVSSSELPGGLVDEDLNIWRGSFPNLPAVNVGPVAVDLGRPNAFGLYHTSGNVWEWTADGFSKLHSPRPQRNPSGALNAERKVVKGGSFLCHDSYCGRYRPSSRRGEMPEATTSHMGFRLARPKK